MIFIQKNYFQNIKLSVCILCFIFLMQTESFAFLKSPPAPKGWIEVKHSSKNPCPIPSSAEKNRGYIIFQRSIMDPVFATSRPLKNEKVTELIAFGTPGEFEPLTFTVYSLRKLNNLNVTISDLKTKSNSIPATNISVRILTYWNIPFPKYNTRDQYKYMPELLEPATPISFPAKTCYRYWLTVNVPENTPKGIYSGTVKIAEQGKQSKLLQVKFRVLGFKLKKDPKKHFSAYFYMPKISFRHAPQILVDEKLYDRVTMTEYKTMVNYGFDIFPVINSFYNPKTMKLKIDFLDELKKMKIAGMQGPVILAIAGLARYYQQYTGIDAGKHWHNAHKMPDRKFFDHISKMVKEIEAVRKREGLPEFIYNPMDEVGVGVKELGAAIHRAVKKAGVKVYASKNIKAADASAYFDAVDVWCGQPFSVPYEETVKNTKYTYWSYPNHNACEVKDRVVMGKGGRMTYGFGLWRSGYTALIPWHWRWQINNPFDYCDGSKAGCGFRIDKQGNMYAPYYWECFREGYDDGRYIYTLQQAIAEREKFKDQHCQKLVASAKKCLQKIWDSINVQEKYKKNGMWNSAEFNVKRWKIAKLIEMLHAYPGKKGITADSVTVQSTSFQKPKQTNYSEKDVEVYNLGDETFEKWKNSTAEGKITVIEDKAYKGKKCLRYDVHINHETDGGGEAGKYPIGWPRIVAMFPKGELSINDYDIMSLWIMVDSNRDEVADDISPLYYEFSFKNSNGISRKITGSLLKECDQRVWIPVNIDLRSVITPALQHLDADGFYRLQFWLREGEYAHGNKVTFFIDDIKLIKFHHPVIKSVDMVSAIFLYTKKFPVSFDLYGATSIEKGKYFISGKIKNKNGRTVVSAKKDLFNSTILVFDTSKVKSKGKYTMEISIKDASGKTLSEWTSDLRCMTGPAG
jgi:glycosyl hydrolase family 123